MGKIELKDPSVSYRKRFNRFLWLLISVKGMKPKDRHLWRVMDGVAFQGTETALETELYNDGQTLDADKAERLTLAVLDARQPGGRRGRKAVARQ